MIILFKTKQKEQIIVIVAGLGYVYFVSMRRGVGDILLLGVHTASGECTS